MATVYYNITNIKNILGETANTNDAKIGLYAIQAQNWIDMSLTKLETTLPLATPIPTIISNFCDSLAAAYFYKFESGDNAIADWLESVFETQYKRNKYNRPRFITRSSPGGR